MSNFSYYSNLADCKKAFEKNNDEIIIENKDKEFNIVKDQVSYLQRDCDKYEEKNNFTNLNLNTSNQNYLNRHFYSVPKQDFLNPDFVAGNSFKDDLHPESCPLRDSSYNLNKPFDYSQVDVYEYEMAKFDSKK